MLLQQLKYFVAVAETGSLSAAAQRLFVTQPNLSKSIANLEDEYKAKLFNRTARGMVLTEEGSMLYQNAKNILNEIYQLDIAFGLIKPHKRKKLSVAAPFGVMIDMAAVAFDHTKDDDQEKCDIEVKKLSTEEAVESVVSSSCEIGFINAQQQHAQALAKLLKRKDLEYTSIGISDLYAYIGPLNPLYDADSIRFEQLLGYPVICSNEKECVFGKEFADQSHISFKSFSKAYFISSDYVAVNLLRSTDAIYLGDCRAFMGISEFGIKIIRVSDSETKFKLGWIKRKEAPLSQDATLFIDAVNRLYSLRSSKDEAIGAQQAGFKLRDFNYLRDF